MFLTAVYFILILPTLGKFRLLGLDEAHYAAIAGHAVFDGHWLPLYWKGAPFIDKPPFFIWIQALLLKIAGTPLEWPVRLPALISACVMWYYFILIAWRLSGSSAAAAALFVLGAFQKHSILYARCGTLDMALLACLMAAVWNLSQVFEKDSGDGANRKLLYAGLWCAGAVLIKSWFGFVLFIPAAAVLILSRPWPFKAGALKNFFLPPVIAMACWFVYSALVSGTGALKFEFGYNTLGRLSGGGLAELLQGKPLTSWIFWSALFSSGAASLWPALLPGISCWLRVSTSEPGRFIEMLVLAFLLFWSAFIYLLIVPYINYFLPMIPLGCLAIGVWINYMGNRSSIFVLAAVSITGIAAAFGRIGDSTIFILSAVLAVFAVLTCKKEKASLPVIILLMIWALFTAAGSINFIIRPPDQHAKLAAFARQSVLPERNHEIIWSGDPMIAQVMEFYSGYKVREEKEYPSNLQVPAFIRNSDGSFNMIYP